MTISTNLQRFRSLPEGAVIEPATGRVVALATDLASWLGVAHASVSVCRHVRVDHRFYDIEKLLENYACGHGRTSKIAKEILNAQTA